MSTFHLTINTDNAAFTDAENPTDELVRLLHETADRIEQENAAPSHYLTIHDINGNDCGRYALITNW